MKKILAIVILGGLGVLAGIFVVVNQSTASTPQIQQLVTEYLHFAARQDIDGVYSLTSSAYQKAVSKKDTRTFIHRKELFEGFKEQIQNSLDARVVPGKPTEYDYSGTITYQDGATGEVTATIIKENWEYKILTIKIHKNLPT
jgi:hypothetical protein